MAKISKVTAVLIVFLIFVVLLGLVIMTNDVIKQAQEPQVGGLDIQFANGTTELEVKAIFENYGMAVNYTIDYDSKNMLKRYYLTVDQDKKMHVINELKKDEDWISYTEIEKGNYSIIMLPENFIPNEEFLTTLEKNNLQLKKSLFCYVHVGDGSTSWISEKSAIRIKNELETNEKVLIVGFDYRE